MQLRSRWDTNRTDSCKKADGNPSAFFYIRHKRSRTASRTASRRAFREDSDRLRYCRRERIMQRHRSPARLDSSRPHHCSDSLFSKTADLVWTGSLLYGSISFLYIQPVFRNGIVRESSRFEPTIFRAVPPLLPASVRSGPINGIGQPTLPMQAKFGTAPRIQLNDSYRFRRPLIRPASDAEKDDRK